MSDVYLLAESAETALGGGEANLFEALRSGRSGAAPVTRFDASRLIASKAVCIDVSPEERKAGENLTQALLRRLFPRLSHLPPVDSIIWAGVKGNAEFIESGQGIACPYPHLPRHYSHWIRDELGWPQARLLEVNAACVSSTLGLALGAERIASGRCRSALVIAADIVSRFSFAGFSALNALTPDTCRPFDSGRDGLLLGDGAGAIVLSGEEYARDSGMPPLARLSGWGMANDANHITAPARDGRGLVAAIQAALQGAGLKPDDVGAVCAHGTGTVYNDAMELTAVETIFGERRFPVFSIKGAVGHTLGAAGCIETLISVRALAERIVPPTSGLRSPEPRAVGRASEAPQKFRTGAILKISSGFGGVNVALLLESAAGADT